MYYQIKFINQAGVERIWPMDAYYQTEADAREKQIELRNLGMTHVRVVLTDDSKDSCGFVGRTLL